MSWDVILLNLPQDVRTFNDLGDDADSVIGPVLEVRQTISRILPTLDLTDPAWGILEGDDFSIEFSIGSDDPCTSVMLHVRGTESALQPIASVCAATGWQAFDCSDGELIDWSADPGRGLRAWREYLNQVAPGAPVKGVSLPTHGGQRVFFDAPPAPSERPKRKPWWKFWA